MNDSVKLDKLEFVATSCIVSAGDYSFQIWDSTNLDTCLPDKYIGFTRYGTTDAFAKFSMKDFNSALMEDQHHQNNKSHVPSKFVTKTMKTVLVKMDAMVSRLQSTHLQRTKSNIPITIISQNSKLCWILLINTNHWFPWTLFFINMKQACLYRQQIVHKSEMAEMDRASVYCKCYQD